MCHISGVSRSDPLRPWTNSVHGQTPSADKLRPRKFAGATVQTKQGNQLQCGRSKRRRARVEGSTFCHDMEQTSVVQLHEAAAKYLPTKDPESGLRNAVN